MLSELCFSGSSPFLVFWGRMLSIFWRSVSVKLCNKTWGPPVPLPYSLKTFRFDVACQINAVLSLWSRLLISRRRTWLFRHGFPHDWIRHSIRPSHLCLWARGRARLGGTAAAGAGRCEDLQCLSRGAARYIPPRCRGLFSCERTTGALCVVSCLLWWLGRDGKAHMSVSTPIMGQHPRLNGSLRAL